MVIKVKEFWDVWEREVEREREILVMKGNVNVEIKMLIFG